MSQSQEKNTTQEFINKKITPWIPVILAFASFLGIAKIVMDSHYDSRASDEVKLAKERTAQLMFQAEIAKAEEKKASYEISNAQVVIPSNPFPTNRGE